MGLRVARVWGRSQLGQLLSCPRCSRLSMFLHGMAVFHIRTRCAKASPSCIGSPRVPADWRLLSSPVGGIQRDSHARLTSIFGRLPYAHGRHQWGPRRGWPCLRRPAEMTNHCVVRATGERHHRREAPATLGLRVQRQPGGKGRQVRRNLPVRQLRGTVGGGKPACLGYRCRTRLVGGGGAETQHLQHYESPRRFWLLSMHG